MSSPEWSDNSFEEFMEVIEANNLTESDIALTPTPCSALIADERSLVGLRSRIPEAERRRIEAATNYQMGRELTGWSGDHPAVFFAFVAMNVLAYNWQGGKVSIDNPVAEATKIVRKHRHPGVLAAILKDDISEARIRPLARTKYARYIPEVQRMQSEEGRAAVQGFMRLTERAACYEKLLAVIYGERYEVARRYQKDAPLVG